jgi:hypothetical protein
VGHRTSWGILPQTPVFSLRSARCHWGKAPSLSGLEHPGPKPLLVSQLHPRQRAERSEKAGVWGRIPQEARSPTYKDIYICSWSTMIGEIDDRTFLLVSLLSWGSHQMLGLLPFNLKSCFPWGSSSIGEKRFRGIPGAPGEVTRGEKAQTKSNIPT